MKILIFIISLITVLESGYSQNKSKVDEYLNEKKPDKEINVSKDTIKKQKTPGVGFSIEGKKGVDQNFLQDEFVRGMINQSNGTMNIMDNGDIEFSSQGLEKPSYDESTQLKDDEQYTDEEIRQFSQMADQYYQFKDFDEYEDYYYYYDQSALEQNIETRDEEVSALPSTFVGYLTSIIKSIFPKNIMLAINSDLDSAINNLYGARPKPSRKPSSSKPSYNVAAAANANIRTIDEAINYYKSHSGQFGNNRFMAVLDFSKHSAKSRFYIINLRTEKVIAAYHVAHGSGSDKDNDGYATYFSNQPDSKASSLGVYKTGEIYQGKYGRSLRLHGLSPTNSNVYSRAIVIHPAPYVKEADVKPGRSWGCMAFDYKVSGDVINMLRDGAFIYAKYAR